MRKIDRWFPTILGAAIIGFMLGTDTTSCGEAVTWLDRFLFVALLLIFVDAGYQWGQHRLAEKLRTIPKEENIR